MTGDTEHTESSTAPTAGHGPVDRLVRHGAEARPLVERLRQRAHNGIAPMHELARLDMLAAAAEIERMHADADRAKGLIQRLATEARQSGDLVRDPEALALAAMYYGA